MAVRFPTNREEGVAYAEELANGIKLWMIIDVVFVSVSILLSCAFGRPSLRCIGFASLFLVGCRIIMTLGYSIGCLQYLELKECYKIVKAKLLNK